MMSRPVIVTGGAGFIGRNVVAALNARGVDDVLIVDHLGKSEKWKNLVGLQYEEFLDKAEFLRLVSSDSMAPAEAVIHLGACSSTTERDAGYLLENNYRYTRSLCEWCLGHGARFIYASSAATYGDGSLGYSDDDAVTLKLRPLNMYGYSKHMFDLWALRHGLFDRIAGLKYFNVYGPYEGHKGNMRSMVHKAFEQICATGEVKLFKSNSPKYRDGEQLRDFIYVRDAVDVTLHFYDDREVSGLFNCGSGQTHTWIELANGVFAAMGREPKIRFVEMPGEISEMYQNFTQADTAKLRKSGCNVSFTSLADGICAYVQSHLAASE